MVEENSILNEINNEVNVNDALNLAINMSDNIYIMGHKYVDLDSLGSCLGLLKYCLDNNKNAYVYINPNEFNVSVIKASKMLNFSISRSFVTVETKINITDKDLLVILDTNKKEIVENYEFFSKFKNTFVLDHHEIKDENKLSSTINFVDSNASSMIEIICDFFKHMEYDLNDKDIASIMYTGMCIDTNNFDNNTRANTFRAAAYLRDHGADIQVKKELFQERKEDILNRNRLLKRSTTIDDNTMVCVLDSNIYTRDELAKISNELLKIDNINMAFTIGKVATNSVGISARCFETEDVELYMTLLGGGGHKTAAATVLNGVSLNKAKEMLLECIGNKDIITTNKAPKTKKKTSATQ